VPVEHLFAIRERLVQAEPGLKHRISALRRRVLFHALEEVGYSEKHAQELANEGFEVFLHARHQVEVFPEVQPVLNPAPPVRSGWSPMATPTCAWAWRTTSALPCAPRTWASPSRMAPFMEALKLGGWTQGRRCTSATSPGR
jgi:hypothetical protein